METDTKIAATMEPVQQVSKLKSELALTASGVVLPQSLTEVTELAQYMCKAGSSIPALMRNNPGECMGVIFDAMNWGMNPFAVARQRYIVESKDGNQVGAYMSQLITAVIQKFAPIKEKVIAPIYEGEGPERRCIIRVHHRDTGEMMEYTSPPVGPDLNDGGNERVKSPGKGYVGIWPKNSPLWRTDTDQQLWYYSIRAWGRRFVPGVLLGVYDIDEARQMAEEMRDITPKKQRNLLEDPEDAPAPMAGEVIEPERKPAGVGTMQGSGWNKAAEDFADTEDHEHDDTTIGEAEEARKIIAIDAAGGSSSYDPRTGKITVPAESQGEFPMAEQPIKPERVYMNLVKGAKSCRTSRDYAAWRADNINSKVKAEIGAEYWKKLGEVMADVETEVGYL